MRLHNDHGRIVACSTMLAHVQSHVQTARAICIASIDRGNVADQAAIRIVVLSALPARVAALMKTRYQNWPSETDAEIRVFVLDFAIRRLGRTQQRPRVRAHFTPSQKVMQKKDLLAGVKGFEPRHSIIYPATSTPLASGAHLRPDVGWRRAVYRVSTAGMAGPRVDLIELHRGQ